MLYTPPNKDLELASLKRDLAAHSSLGKSSSTMTRKKKRTKKRTPKRANKVCYYFDWSKKNVKLN